MNIKIIPKPLVGQVNAITSKSHAHRLLIAAALCCQPCNVIIDDMNKDLEATQNCLSQLGDGIGNTGVSTVNEIISKDVSETISIKVPVLNCQESGSTLRFMLPITMALKSKAVFMGSGRLPERPLSPLKEEMENHGCIFTRSDGIEDLQTDGRWAVNPSEIYTVSGALQGGKFRLPGNISSQYITGLLFALPLLEEDSTLVITTKLESSGYVMLTLQVLELFGIDIRVKKGDNHNLSTEEVYSFHIKGKQKYISPGEVTGEGDWSNGAFWMVAAALNYHRAGVSTPGIRCNNLNSQSLQGDKAIVDFIEEFKNSKAGEKLVFDVAQVPDLVPALAVLATARRGVTLVQNAGRLRIKESDRLSTVHEMLETLGGNVEELAEGLIIYGEGELTGGFVNSHNDHRIAMAATIATVICKRAVTILGAEAVEKSYPRFFEDFKKLGGECCVL